VYEETTINNFPSSQVIFSAIQEKWLQVQTVASIPNQISNLLDKGEREVIALALLSGTKRVLLDEKEARKIAQTFDLKVMGTLGILILAKNNNIIPQVKPLLDAMISDAQYWVNSSLYQQILQQVGEEILNPEKKSLSLYQKDLAERLGVSSATILRYRIKTSFANWSKEKDPEGIAWQYSPKTGFFTPIDE
ncbi:MAG TPA: DUF3368 domain-containing protein, partial [Allocoleopsis sp.]